MKNNIKKIFYIILVTVIFFNTAITTHAQEIDEELELTIIENDTFFKPITPESTTRGLYITTGTTRISEVSTGKVYLRVDINCIETVSSIQSVLTLQKLVNGTWTNIASKTVSTTNANTMSKTVSASGLSSGGTYRARSVTKVTPYLGASETATGYSGAIILS